MKVSKVITLSLITMLMMALAAGCAKKHLKDEGGLIKPQAQGEVSAPASSGEAGEGSGGREVFEAPRGTTEAAEPLEAPRPEKALAAIYFDFDKYEITQAAAQVLQANYGWIRANPGLVTIEGHCDELGTVEYNLALGERRAEAARDYLTALGVQKSRLKTISYGKSKPLDKGHTEEAWAMNRRAHFVVSD